MLFPLGTSPVYNSNTSGNQSFLKTQIREQVRFTEENWSSSLFQLSLSCTHFQHHSTEQKGGWHAPWIGVISKDFSMPLSSMWHDNSEEIYIQNPQKMHSVSNKMMCYHANPVLIQDWNYSKDVYTNAVMKLHLAITKPSCYGLFYDINYFILISLLSN